MSARQEGGYHALARKWLALAERRHAHLIELRASGRWKHYFSESELDVQLREVDLARGRFANILGLEPPNVALVSAPSAAVIVPLADAEVVARSQSSYISAIEAALNAAAELQESAEKSAA
jgi:hypothetical protein